MPRRSKATREQFVEEGIDVIDRMRGDMRKLGMTEAAEALDHAFAKCLRAYLGYIAKDPRYPRRNGNGSGNGGTTE
ncbi:hypothetical protein [Asticcacaulis sp.]|uniref:hypothetical protein n=1 Tax=Asticcacaulis sp. TaxID=1872648 RepID=UPI002BB026EA|nr:hypothetical protein [Asticcacaulis sp.]HTM81892.1 hypothetical protein [Asticcacaulis sp.]